MESCIKLKLLTKFIKQKWIWKKGKEGYKEKLYSLSRQKGWNNCKNKHKLPICQFINHFLHVILPKLEEKKISISRLLSKHMFKTPVLSVLGLVWVEWGMVFLGFLVLKAKS